MPIHEAMVATGSEQQNNRVAMLVRVHPRVHRRAKDVAEARGESLTQLVERVLSRELGVGQPGQGVAQGLRRGLAR